MAQSSELTKTEQRQMALMWDKVRYEVRVDGKRATVKCHLPEVFSMREYTRIYNLAHAKDLKMTDREYIEYQHEKLKEDLFNRLPLDKRKLLKGDSDVRNKSGRQTSRSHKQNTLR